MDMEGLEYQFMHKDILHLGGKVRVVVWLNSIKLATIYIVFLDIDLYKSFQLCMSCETRTSETKPGIHLF